LTGAGEPQRLTAVPVTENLFALLGVEPETYPADRQQAQASSLK